MNIPSLEPAKILELSPSNNTGDKHGSKQNR